MTDLPVEIIRSPRRRRTLQASYVDGRIKVRVPAGLDPSEESRLIEELAAKVLRKIASAHVDLTERAEQLARRHQLPKPTSIEWSTRQMSRWGSCTPSEGRIRISNRLAAMPGWVLDSVVVHELAHLAVADHGPRFKTLVDRYQLTERAKGYLMAKSEEPEQPD